MGSENFSAACIDGEELLHEPDWTLDELWSSTSDTVHLKVHLTFGAVKTACEA